MKTCPRQVEVYKSGIPNAGNGVWAKEEIPENTVFGPYEGLKVHPRDIHNVVRVKDRGYAWEVRFLSALFLEHFN